MVPDKRQISKFSLTARISVMGMGGTKTETPSHSCSPELMEAAAAKAVRMCILCPCLAVIFPGEKPLRKQKYSKLSPFAKGRGWAEFCSRDVVLGELLAFCSVCAAQAAERSLLTLVTEARGCSGELGCLFQCESGSLGSAKPVNLGCCVCVGVKQCFVLPWG